MKTVETPKHATYCRLVYVAAESLSEGEGSSTQLYTLLVIYLFYDLFCSKFLPAIPTRPTLA